MHSKDQSPISKELLQKPREFRAKLRFASIRLMGSHPRGYSSFDGQQDIFIGETVNADASTEAELILRYKIGKGSHQLQPMNAQFSVILFIPLSSLRRSSFFIHSQIPVIYKSPSHGPPCTLDRSPNNRDPIHSPPYSHRKVYGRKKTRDFLERSSSQEATKEDGRRKREARAQEGRKGMDIRERGALIICTRTSPLSCGRRTRPFQLWHSGLSRLQPGCSPLSSPQSRRSIPCSSFLSCSFLRGYHGAPFHPENFNYNRNYPPKKVLPEYPRTNNPTTRTVGDHLSATNGRAAEEDANEERHCRRQPPTPCVHV